MFKPAAIFASVLLGLAAVAPAQSVVLDEGSTDLTLYRPADNLINTGAIPALFSDGPTRSRILLKFNASPLAGKIVKSAKLKLVWAGNYDGAPVPFSIYQICDANADWNEGDNVFTQADAGEPCWEFKAYSDIKWAGSAGLSLPDIDFVAAPIATGTRDDTHDDAAASTIDIPASVVQHWIEKANAGILIVSDVDLSGPIQIYSGENGPNLRPTLTVEAEYPAPQAN